MSDLSSIEAAVERPFLTPQEVSELLQVSVQTVRRWIKEEDLPAYKVGPRMWRIKVADLDHWIEGQRVTPDDFGGDEDDEDEEDGDDDSGEDNGDIGAVEEGEGVEDKEDGGKAGDLGDEMPDQDNEDIDSLI